MDEKQVKINMDALDQKVSKYLASILNIAENHSVFGKTNEELFSAIADIARDAIEKSLRDTYIRKMKDSFRDLVPGQRIIVRMDNGSEREFTVKYEPWQLGHGTWVVGLEGIAGGYALDRVVRIVDGQEAHEKTARRRSSDLPDIDLGGSD